LKGDLVEFDDALLDEVVPKGIRRRKREKDTCSSIRSTLDKKEKVGED
jgi:hypothetical protein